MSPSQSSWFYKQPLKSHFIPELSLDFGWKVIIPLPLLRAWFSGKESTCQCRSHRRCRLVGSNPGSGRSPGVRNGNPLQYSCWGPIIPWTEETDRPLSSWGRKESDVIEHDDKDHYSAFFCLHQAKRIFYLKKKTLPCTLILCIFYECTVFIALFLYKSLLDSLFLKGSAQESYPFSFLCISLSKESRTAF